jgi:hypothetical protein
MSFADVSKIMVPAIKKAASKNAETLTKLRAQKPFPLVLVAIGFLILGVILHFTNDANHEKRIPEKAAAVLFADPPLRVRATVDR